MSTPAEKDSERSSRQRGSSECKPLIDAATKNLFRNNAFRITGLPIDASVREISKHANRLTQMTELGLGESANTAAFALKPPPGIDQLHEAHHKLKDPEKRFVDEFFWFWPEEFGQSRSDLAIQALQAGDGDTALDIWTRKETNPKNGVVAMHNVALVWHLTAMEWEGYTINAEFDADRQAKLEGYWRNAFKRWEQLVLNDELWEKVTARIRQINEPDRLPTRFAYRMRTTLPEALDKINAELAVAYAESGKIELARLHIRFMRETNQGLDNFEKTAELVLTPARNRLKEQILRARESAENSPATAAEAARTLIEHALPLLDVFDLFFVGQEHFQKELFDEAATAIVNCLVSYQRKTGDNATFVRLLGRTLSLAQSTEVRRRIEENIAIGHQNLGTTAWLSQTVSSSEEDVGTRKRNSRSKEIDSVYSVLKAIQDSKESPSLRLARFKRDAVDAIIKAAGVSGFSETYGYLSATSADFKELFDSAAIVLRGISLDAWNNHRDRQTAVAANELAVKHATSLELKQRLAEDKATLQQMRHEADLSPISSAPSLSTVNGIGFKLYGSADSDPTTGSYLATYYFVFLAIPIFPICRYRVTSNGNSYRFFGKAPLRPFDKWHLAVSIGLIVLLIIILSSAGDSTTSSNPSSYAPPPPTYTPPPAPSAPAYTPQPTVGSGNSGRNVYRVPSSVSSALDNEKAEIESERITLEALDAQVETLGREIERDRPYLDRTSQFAIDEFNAKVDQYNAINQRAKNANAAFNEKVDNYNAKLRQYGR
jgi:hypothetical protein